ncbi:MAG: heavy metal translocating P-type ATPase [Pirellulaceae bacterium]
MKSTMDESRLSELRSRSLVELPCIHCSEPTECTEGTPAEQVFCCSGCRGAYELIHGWGLGDFYALRDQMRRTGTANPAGVAKRYEQFDTPEFLGQSTPRQHDDGLCSTELAVQGLHCAACAWLIERATAHEPGLRSARVSMSDHTLRVIFDPQTTKLSQIAQLLDRLGYHLSPLDRSRDKHLETENRRLLTQIAIAAFLAANAMWIAVALYAGDYSGLEPGYRYFMGLVGTALGVTATLGPGRTFFVGALASLKTRTPHMDLPVALGLTVGTVAGTVNAIAGRGHVYFDTLATLVFLLLIGRWIQFRQQQRAARAVDLMLRITPRHANLIDADNGSEPRLVLVERLEQGDMVRVLPGESVPTDGTIFAGSSKLDRSLLTGESLPVSVSVGDAVAAGTVNLTAPFDYQVTAVGRESRIGRVMQSVESAATEKTPIVQLADRIGGMFVVTVTALAAITFVAWSLPGLTVESLAMGTSHATALLIVACPCALALATPLAIAVGLGRAARSNILIRDGQSLQLLSRPGMIWFDKTGTLTEGRQRVSQTIGDLDALAWAAALERECHHPIAAAIVREAERRGLPLPEASLEQLQAGGIVGRVGNPGVVAYRVAVGNQQLMRDIDAHVSELMQNATDELLSKHESPVLIAVDGQVRTVLGITDPIRKQAKQVIDSLQSQGWQVGLLSGDHDAIAQKVGAELGIATGNCHGGLTPEEKLAAIRQARQTQPATGRKAQVVMVGDGANDAAALAAADVGIAVRGGAEVSLQAAPVFVGSGDLLSILHLLDGSRRTTRLIYLSFAVSLAYNLIAVALAMTGWITPLVAAVLMPISSVSVLALTFATKTFESESVPSPLEPNCTTVSS